MRSDLEGGIGMVIPCSPLGIPDLFTQRKQLPNDFVETQRAERSTYRRLSHHRQVVLVRGLGFVEKEPKSAPLVS